MASFESESKEAITWVIPSISFILAFIAPLFKDIRFYLLVLFLILYINYIKDFEDTKEITNKLKTKSLACTSIIYGWFIYSNLFYHSVTVQEPQSTISIIISIVHVVMGIGAAVLDNNNVHNVLMFINGILISFAVFNITNEFNIEHVWTQILFYVICWYMEMILDALFTTKRNISIGYLFTVCIPILRSRKVLMFSYGTLLVVFRLYELYYIHYPKQKMLKITSLPMATKTPPPLLPPRPETTKDIEAPEVPEKEPEPEPETPSPPPPPPKRVKSSRPQRLNKPRKKSKENIPVKRPNKKPTGPKEKRIIKPNFFR